MSNYIYKKTKSNNIILRYWDNGRIDSILQGSADWDVYLKDVTLNITVVEFDTTEILKEKLETVYSCMDKLTFLTLLKLIKILNAKNIVRYAEYGPKIKQCYEIITYIEEHSVELNHSNTLNKIHADLVTAVENLTIGELI